MAAASIVNAPSSCPKDVRPPIASFTPSLWGHIFTSFSLDDQVLQEKYAEAIEALKDEARSMLMAKGNTIKDYDLFTAALQFRLLRQHRHHVSCSIFDKFKGEDNKFKEALNSDAKGLLSLYEAAHVRIHGEEILEEAVIFTTHHLNRMAQQLDSHFIGVPRIETRQYISIYEKDDSKNELLLKLAKLDFNYLQNMYKKELHELSRWWNEFDLKSKLPYARDRVVESYFWGVALRFEPQYSYVRVAVAKAIQMLTTMDDTYDNYATLEEADLFTEILERWNINEIDRLPDYMKIFYRFILSIYDDYEREAAIQGKLFAVPYAKETVKQISRAYNKDLKWFMGRQMPAFEDYLANSVFTGCIYVMLTAIIPGMKSASEEIIDWLMSEPKIVIASAKMGRYVDDLASHKVSSTIH
ncbi:hypothetical protein Pfo_006625 [Paulownia fortunei]|nr:hypothetical protein Pfo_006625 [Paulownia fortunei]